MAQTFRDFIVECELYPYSKENFEIMKECSELRLQEKYLENARYAESAASMYTVENGYHLSEGYFQESVEDTFLEEVEKDTEKKKTGLLGKILNGIKWLIGKLAQFFRFLAGKLDKLAGNTEAVAKKVQVWDLTNPDNVQALMDALLLKGTNAVMPIKNFACEVLDLTKLNITSLSANALNYLKYYLAILFGIENIRILPNDTEGPLNLGKYIEEDTGVIDVNTLGEVLKLLSNTNTKARYSESNIKAAISAFNDALETTKKTGLSVDLKKNKIEEIIKQLDDYKVTLNNIKNDFDFDFRAGSSSDSISILQTFISPRLTKCISKTLEFYGDLLKYKNEALPKVNELVSTTPTEGEKKAEETPTESK